MTIVNRAGFSAWIGGAGWAGLTRGSRYLFTVEAVRRLVATTRPGRQVHPLVAPAPA